MESTDSKFPWRTYLLVGGALLSCGLGVFAMRRLSKLSERPAAPNASANNTTSIAEEPGIQREYNREQNDVVRERPPCTTWTQTFEEVFIEVPITQDVKPKDIKCTFNTKSLNVKIKEREVLAGELYQDITPDDCSWELEGDGVNRTLTISLIKGAFHEGHWHHVLNDDSKNGQAVLAS